MMICKHKIKFCIFYLLFRKGIIRMQNKSSAKIEKIMASGQFSNPCCTERLTKVEESMAQLTGWLKQIKVKELNRLALYKQQETQIVTEHGQKIGGVEQRLCRVEKCLQRLDGNLAKLYAMFENTTSQIATKLQSLDKRGSYSKSVEQEIKFVLQKQIGMVKQFGAQHQELSSRIDKLAAEYHEASLKQKSSFQDTQEARPSLQDFADIKELLKQYKEVGKQNITEIKLQFNQALSTIDLKISQQAESISRLDQQTKVELKTVKETAEKRYEQLASSLCKLCNYLKQRA